MSHSILHQRACQVLFSEDVTFNEERSQVCCGRFSRITATLRNMVISLIRLSGAINIAAAWRSFTDQPWQALALSGTNPEN